MRYVWWLGRLQRWLWWRVRRLWGLDVSSDLPVLGVGLGYREPYLTDLFLHQRDVDFVEIVADHYIDAPPEKEEECCGL